MGRDHAQPGAARGPVASASSGFAGPRDAIAQGHQAVHDLDGGMLSPRISTWAAHAISQRNFAAARDASMRWHLHKPSLVTLAQSLDPGDPEVARAQALLDDMAPLEAQLPDLFEFSFTDAEAPEARARWLARISREESAAAPRPGATADPHTAAGPAAATQPGAATALGQASASGPTNVKLALTGLAGLFRLYQRHRDTAALETAYATNTVSDGSGLAPDTSQSDAASADLQVALRANGFADVRAFEALVHQYERAFEAGAAEVVFTMLDRATVRLSAEAARYRSPDAVRALHAQLGGFRGHHRDAQAAVADHGHVVMGMQFGLGAARPTGDDLARAGGRVAETQAQASADLASLAADHPVLRDDGLPDGKRLDRAALAGATVDTLGPMLARNLAQRLGDIAEVRGRLAGHPGLVYGMDRLFPQFYAALGIAPGSVFDLIVADKRHRDASQQILDAVGLAVLAAALSAASFGAATPALAAAAGGAGVGIGAYSAYQDYQDYTEQNDLADVGFTSHASVGWLIVSFAGAGVDVAGAAGAVGAARTANAIRALVPAAEAVDAAGDVAQFTKAVRALEAAGELDAKAARAAERAAAARAELAVAGRDLIVATSRTTNSIIGPLTEPAVYKAIYNVAKATLRAGYHTAEEYFERLRLARHLKVIDELSPEELAIAKQAWQEAEAAVKAEQAKAGARALGAGELGPPHASWDPALGEALEAQLREATVNNKQHRVATSIQQLSRSPHGAELARRLLDPRIKAAKGYDAIVQRLLSIDEPKQAQLIAELVDAEHLLETGDLAKQTLSLGETSNGTRLGDPGHYDLDAALVDADGTIAQGIQTYRPTSTDLRQVLKEIRKKMQGQLRVAPAAEKTLAVHVDGAMKQLLQGEHGQLSGLAERQGISIDVVSPDGTRLHFPGGAR